MDAPTGSSPDTAWIAGRARTLGFDLCGVVRASCFPELERMQEWLARGYAGDMRYLRDPRRGNPSSLKDGIRSAIVCAVNYNTEWLYSTKAASQSNTGEHRAARGWISRYAWGKDYHEVLWDMLNRLIRELHVRFGQGFEAYAYADTGPIHERVLAKYAGLGWIGKNTLLLNQRFGSWLFLGAVLTSLELEPSLGRAEAAPADLCGTCRKCLDACPTGSLVEPYVMDARRCISYLSIELRGAIPEEFREAMGWHVFGCDICQDVCPWNRKAPITEHREFQPRMRGSDPRESLFMPELSWLAEMEEEGFRRSFGKSAIKRAKWRGMLRNACIALGNATVQPGTKEAEHIAALLEKLARSKDAVIAESAEWALSRIQRDRKVRTSDTGAPNSHPVERCSAPDV